MIDKNLHIPIEDIHGMNITTKLSGKSNKSASVWLVQCATWGGIGFNRECNEYDKTGKNPQVHKFRILINYIIDRNTLRLYEKVEERVDMSDKCNTDWNRNYYVVPKGRDLETFSKPCSVSKIQFWLTQSVSVYVLWNSKTKSNTIREN